MAVRSSALFRRTIMRVLLVGGGATAMSVKVCPAQVNGTVPGHVGSVARASCVVQDGPNKISYLRSQRVSVAEEAYTNRADLHLTQKISLDLRKYPL
jgi:hypothetical protein